MVTAKYRMSSIAWSWSLWGASRPPASSLQRYSAISLRLAGHHQIRCVVADPSAASFITALRQAGYRVVKANNDVLSGIRITADLLKKGRIVICGDDVLLQSPLRHGPRVPRRIKEVVNQPLGRGPFP